MLLSTNPNSRITLSEDKFALSQIVLNPDEVVHLLLSKWVDMQVTSDATSKDTKISSCS